MKDLSRSVCYYRVSTQRQFEDYSSFEAYRQRFIDFGFIDLTQHFTDIASGGDNSREGYQKVLNLVRHKLVDSVYIPELSRLSRDVAGFEVALEYFTITGVSLKTLDGHTFRFDTPLDRTSARLMMVMASQEREMYKYRSLNGHKFLREQQRPVRPVFPYLKTKEKLIPNHNLYKSSGKSVWQIGRELVETYLKLQNLSHTIKYMMSNYGSEKDPSVWLDYTRQRSSFRDWLVSETIRGNLAYFGNRRYKYLENAPEPLICYSTHEPLITTDEYTEILKILKIGSTSKRNVSTLRNLWGDRLRCECSNSMKVSLSKSGSKVYYYLVCKDAYTDNNIIRAKQELKLVHRCQNRSSYGLTVEKLDEIVMDALCDRAEVIANTYFPDERTLEISPEILDLNQKIDTYQLLVDSGDLDLLPLLTKKIKQRDHLIAESEKTNNQLNNSITRNKLVTYGRNRVFWQNATANEKRLLYQEFIKEIVCTRGEVTISFLV